MSDVDRSRHETRVDAGGPSAVAVPDRDDDLDTYRALAMIGVVWVHCLYFPRLLGANWDAPKSWMLIEMPVLFFVAGASATLGRPQPALASFVTRAARLLVPYWLFALICLGLEATTGVGLARINEAYILAWLLPIATPPGSIAPLHWPIWFIPVYLGVFLVFPALRALRDALPRWARFAPLLAIAGLVYLGQGHAGFDRTRHVVLYSFWAYLGLFYAEFRARPWPRPALLATSLAAYAALAALIVCGHDSPNIQTSKFPPALPFLLMSVGHVGLLALARRPILRAARGAPLRWLVAPYRRYGYTIFLYHAFVFLAWDRLRAASPAVNWFAARHPRPAVLLLAAGVILLAPVVARPFAFLERVRVRFPGSGGRSVPPPHRHVAAPAEGAHRGA